MRICSTCKIEKPFSEFHKRYNSYQHRCKTCKRVTDNARYKTNPRKRQLNDKRRKEMLQKIWQLKSERGCKICRENCYACLDFHHIDTLNKLDCVSQMCNKNAFNKALEEIEKCIVLCSNCHRKLHAGLVIL